jgi:phosphatidylethanolamine/phosphatidyl-N-methylethanolamine N-methyltransferase
MASAVMLPHESKIYSQFARFYDRIFTGIFYPRIATVIGGLEIPPGSAVLEVGVGTGLALSAYPPHCRVTGVDLAPEMLDRARQKIRQEGWRHISLAPGDAQALEFADDSFDYVTSFHVVTVVPDPVRMMNEMVRVCRPGGTIVVINHFRSERPAIAWLIDRLDPLTRKLGWRTTLRLGDVIAGIPLEKVERYKMSPQSLFTVMIAQKPAAKGQARAASG